VGSARSGKSRAISRSVYRPEADFQFRIGQLADGAVEEFCHVPAACEFGLLQGCIGLLQRCIRLAGRRGYPLPCQEDADERRNRQAEVPDHLQNE